MMERRYEACARRAPVFRDHFARLDRQIVLVDALTSLNSGPAAVRDLETAMSEVLVAFRAGKSGFDLDHLPSENRSHPVRRHQGRSPASPSHDRLEAILRLLVSRAIALCPEDVRARCRCRGARRHSRDARGDVKRGETCSGSRRSRRHRRRAARRRTHRRRNVRQRREVAIFPAIACRSKARLPRRQARRA